MARNDISFPRMEGKASRQAHAKFPKGTYEREMGREGFFGPATHMYHRNVPTGWTAWEGPLRPRAFDLTKLDNAGNSPFGAAGVLHNGQTRVRLWNTSGNMKSLARNSDGDELIFVHKGTGEFFCDYGHLSFEPGDYIVIPRSTSWRLECAEPVMALLIESTNGTYQLPDKGILGPHAIFDPGMLDTPKLDDAFEAQATTPGEWRVEVKRLNEISTVTFPFNPLDAVGWKGDLSVVRINVRDIRPLMSHRYHLPPSAHSTFVGNGFIVCTFVPRPFETDEDALKIPFFHNNDDYDEVIFYHAGDFFSRDNIHPGMMSFHPTGFTHGPHPKALEKAFTQTKAGTDEYAVMIDTRAPLEVGEGASSVEWADYHKSWQVKD